jgi:toxin ParE1/3/4
MGAYRLSAAADQRLADIYETSIGYFGLDQAQRYLIGMHDAFQALVDHPQSGKAVPELRSGLRRVLYGSHAIYYRVEDGDIFIVDVLHQGMLPEQHL